MHWHVEANRRPNNIVNRNVGNQYDDDDYDYLDRPEGRPRMREARCCCEYLRNIVDELPPVPRRALKTGLAICGLVLVSAVASSFIPRSFISRASLAGGEKILASAAFALVLIGVAYGALSESRANAQLAAMQRERVKMRHAPLGVEGQD